MESDKMIVFCNIHCMPQYAKYWKDYDDDDDGGGCSSNSNSSSSSSSSSDSGDNDGTSKIVSAQ